MAPAGLYSFLLMVAVAAANLPWLSDRFLLVVKLDKTAAWRWLEWLCCYLLTGALALALEWRATGRVYPQQWEFYVATLCLFVVFALPGFIYHYDLKKLFKS